MANADFTRIATNIGALNALNSLRNVNNKLGMHQERLATGKRINSAADDPAGLTIATKLNTRSEGLKQALSNIGDAKSLLSVTESGLSRINDIAVQMRNKAEAAASDTLGQDERDAIVTQLKEFAAQIDDIVEQTEWNDTKLIDGSFNTTALTFQTGADKGDTTTLNGLKDMKASASGGLNIGSSSTISSANVTGLNSASSASDFATYMDDISTAMDTVSSQLSKVGSLSARLTFKEDQIAVAQVNVESSYNRIMNADMAFEQLESTKYSILQQTSTTMLAQANQAPQGVLSLFR
ncbi:MAG: flagellin [Anaerolineae bacterium]|nr:flagellin [Anaerolineae bacterium]